MKTNVVVGLGVVGEATLRFFRSKYDNFYGIDKKNILEWGIPDDWTFNFNHIDKTCIIWICTREESVIDVIEKYKVYTKNFVIRSTIPPELFDLPEKYPELNIVHVPEFLRENFALEDMKKTNRIIIGGNAPELKIYLKELFQNILPYTPIISDLTFKESALCKIFSNAHLSTLIGFWCEAKKICDNFEVNADRIASVCAMDSRISEYGTICGSKFGGLCLPKDLHYLAELTEVDIPLLKAVEKYSKNERET